MFRQPLTMLGAVQLRMQGGRRQPYFPTHPYAPVLVGYLRVEDLDAEVVVQVVDLLELVAVEPQRLEVHKRVKAADLLDAAVGQEQLRAL